MSKIYTLLCGAAFAPLFYASAAFAQEKGGSDTAGVAEIVVTAERRSENLQRTPVTAAVLTGQDLQAKHVDNLQQLQFATPSLSVGEAGVTESVNIRGIGLGVSSPSVPNGVALYRDGVFQGPLLSSEPLFDMAAIEVLRGPQGTFVGSNSTGGAILYRSVAPTFDKISGYIRGWGGSYDDMGIQGAINLPITGTLAARVAFNVESRDSYFRQGGDLGTLANKGTAGNFNQRNVRLSLKWQPDEHVTLESKTAINREDTNGLAHVMSPANPYYDGRPLEYVLSYNVPGEMYSQRGFRQSLQGDYKFDSGLTARAILGYTRVRSPYVDDFDSSSSAGGAGLPPATSVFANTAYEKTISQEFNLISPEGQRFQWTVGAFHIWDQSNGDVDITEPAAPTQITSRVPNYKESAAGFVQGSYEVVPALQLQAGVRYTSSWAHNTGTTTLYGLAPVPIVQDQYATESDHAWTGKVGANWTVSARHYVYAFAAKGYKSGGINGPTSPDFRPETVYDYEVGLKSSWLGNHLRTQLNGFYMDYRNLQLSSYIIPDASTGLGGANGVVNAGNSKIYGFEGQSQARVGALGVDVSLAYVHSKLGTIPYIDSTRLPGSGNIPLGPQCASGATTSCFNYGPYTQNLAGGPNPYSPTWTVNASVYYDITMPNDVKLTPRVDFTHIDGQYQTILVAPANYIAAHNLVNASLALKKGPWLVEAYGTNLGNVTYIVGYTYGPSYFLGRPREFGGRISRTF